VRYSVIIVVWRDRDVVEACLRSVYAQRLDGEVEVLVVDNASADGTADVLAAHADRVRVLRNEVNTGFSAANNQGARAARGDVLLFLNPDTELVGDDVLRRLGDAVSTPGVGLAGPRLVNPDGTLQPSCAAYPSVGRALLLATGLHRLLPDALRARVAPTAWSHDRSRDADWVMGAALCVRPDVFAEVGGFWPVLYSEDTELAWQVHRRGMAVRYVNEAVVVHLGNYSNAQRLSDAQRAVRVAEGELAFLARHYGRGRATAIRLMLAAGCAARVPLLWALGRRARARELAAMARAYAVARPPTAAVLPSG
jgi:GT2 family glycosyltransferase